MAAILAQEQTAGGSGAGMAPETQALWLQRPCSLLLYSELMITHFWDRLSGDKQDNKGSLDTTSWPSIGWLWYIDTWLQLHLPPQTPPYSAFSTHLYLIYMNPKKEFLVGRSLRIEKWGRASLSGIWNSIENWWKKPVTSLLRRTMYGTNIGCVGWHNHFLTKIWKWEAPTTS